VFVDRERGRCAVFMPTERNQLKKFRLLALFAIMLALALVSATNAVAKDGTNNGATTGTASVAYTWYVGGGLWTCDVTRIVKTAPKAFTKDSESCQVSDVASLIFPPGTYDATLFWYSDYDYFVNGTSVVPTSGKVVISDNGDGTGTVNIVAYF